MAIFNSYVINKLPEGIYIHIEFNVRHLLRTPGNQQPVVGFSVKKLSLTTNQGPDWFKRQVQFDSDTEFQVCKNMSNRCV